eukprot:SAG11_NODE_147_length_14771_cov_3.279648_8_plen_152_part_00
MLQAAYSNSPNSAVLREWPAGRTINNSIFLNDGMPAPPPLHQTPPPPHYEPGSPWLAIVVAVILLLGVGVALWQYMLWRRRDDVSDMPERFEAKPLYNLGDTVDMKDVDSPSFDRMLDDLQRARRRARADELALRNIDPKSKTYRGGRLAW